MPPVAEDNTLQTNEGTLEMADTPTKGPQASHVVSPTDEVHIENGSPQDQSESSSISSESLYTSTTEEEVESDNEEVASAKDLLAMAKERLQHQDLSDKVKELSLKLREKDEQVTQLTGQLRRATQTKCDLVLHCTEMERQQEVAQVEIQNKEKMVQQGKNQLLETRASVEAEFMNELAKLSAQMVDMERVHQNQIVGKDFEIGQLKEQLRRLQESEQ